MDQVRNARDAFPLLGRGGRHQRPGPDEQDAGQLLPLHFSEYMGTEHRGRTTAAGTSGVNVLFIAVVHEQTAVVVFVPEFVPFFLQQLAEQVAANGRQVPGEDQIVILRLGPRILKIVIEGVGRRGGHRGAHVVHIGDAEIGDTPDADRRDMRAAAAQADHGRTGRRGGPLRRRGALTAVFERIPELAFRRAEMGRGDGAADIGCAAWRLFLLV